MARVTVDDCFDKVPNRCELVMLAAHRARSITSGAHPLVETVQDKNPVVALREIAERKLSVDGLREDAIEAQQRHVEVDEPEEAAPGGSPIDAPAPEDVTEAQLMKALHEQMSED